MASNMAPSVWGTRYTIFRDENASPSRGVTESLVQTTVLAEVRGLKGTTEKMAALRPSGSNTAGLGVLDACCKGIYNAMQPFVSNAPSPGKSTETDVAAEMENPSFRA